MESLAEALREGPHSETELVSDPKRSEMPTVRLRLDEAAAGLSAMEVVKQLQDGEPSIHANPSHVREGVVAFGPMCLKQGEPEIIGRRLTQLIGEAGGRKPTR